MSVPFLHIVISSLNHIIYSKLTIVKTLFNERAWIYRYLQVFFVFPNFICTFEGLKVNDTYKVKEMGKT